MTASSLRLLRSLATGSRRLGAYFANYFKVFGPFGSGFTAALLMFEVQIMEGTNTFRSVNVLGAMAGRV